MASGSLPSPDDSFAGAGQNDTGDTEGVATQKCRRCESRKSTVGAPRLRISLLMQKVTRTLCAPCGRGGFLKSVVPPLLVCSTKATTNWRTHQVVSNLAAAGLKAAALQPTPSPNDDFSRGGGRHAPRRTTAAAAQQRWSCCFSAGSVTEVRHAACQNCSINQCVAPPTSPWQHCVAGRVVSRRLRRRSPDEPSRLLVEDEA